MRVDELVESLGAVLTTPSDDVKVVDRITGEWLNINMKKVANFDYQELINFKKVFIYSYEKTNDLNIMRSISLGSNLLSRYLRKNSLNVVSKDFIYSSNFLEISNLILDNDFFKINPDDNLPRTLVSAGNEYKKIFLKNIVLSLLNESKMLPFEHVFYKLSTNVQAEVISQSIQLNSKNNDESNLSKIVKILGMKEASKIIENKSDIKFIKNILEANVQGKNGKENFDMCFKFFHNDIEKNLTHMINDYFSNRNVNLLRELNNRYPEKFKSMLREDQITSFLEGLNKENYKELLDFTYECTNYSLWQKEGLAIKSLYHQSKSLPAKKMMLQSVLREYPIDFKEYYKLDEFMRNRSLKDDVKLSDYEHFKKYTSELVMEHELQKNIQVNEVKEIKRLKF